MITIYSTSWCQFCKLAGRYLSEKGLEFKEINIEEDGISRDDLVKLTGGRSVPQIIVDGKPIGGYDDLLRLDNEKKLIQTVK
tara:strand:- start:607 stop:852 length:246 start_codon:yes stop_codon:yes gene_type:complete